ncbi:MAG: iron-sulfur cluster assembly accessory protein [Anaerolineales bacterium]|nr:iron-sulfur cluster assembly accessory protein [Anaerolineales bacterium]
MIHLTEPAIDRVRKLLLERDLRNHALRVFVSGGGCSGLQYGMGLVDQIDENDLHFQFEDIDVVIDPVSISYMSGSTIDYVDDLMGGGFRIDNPRALASCRCGNSFRTEETSRAKSTANNCQC